MRQRTRTFHVIVERDEAGFYVAECPALRACYSQGKTYREAIDNIKDVISLCVADLKAQRKALPVSPEIIGVQPVEVSV